MTEKKIYGLPSYDMGDWVRGEDRPIEMYIENPKTGFRVYILYPNMRFDLGTRYVVSDGTFSMGFALDKDLAMYHVEYPSEEIPKVFVGKIGGQFMTGSAHSVDGKMKFIKLADATQFQSCEQQELFLDVLKDAVPRIPATGNHAARWNGGFGYQVDFTKKIVLKINGKNVHLCD